MKKIQFIDNTPKVICILLAAVIFSGCTKSGTGQGVKSDVINETNPTDDVDMIANEPQKNVRNGVQLVEEMAEQSDNEGSGDNVNEASGEEDKAVYESQFYISEIPDDIFEFMQGKSYKSDCAIPREDLRYIHVLHVGFDNETHEGEVIANKAVAEDLLDIFRELYEAKYQIEKIRLVDHYNADDEASMEDNNSSCFNFRFISHTTEVSNHGMGLAIDINPLYNPYIKAVNGKENIEPVTAGEYVDRNREFEHKIDEDDLCYKLFMEHGFSWGGSWKSSKDYQHFEKVD